MQCKTPKKCRGVATVAPITLHCCYCCFVVFFCCHRLNLLVTSPLGDRVAQKSLHILFAAIFCLILLPFIRFFFQLFIYLSFHSLVCFAVVAALLICCLLWGKVNMAATSGATTQAWIVGVNVVVFVWHFMVFLLFNIGLFYYCVSCIFSK